MITLPPSRLLGIGTTIFTLMSALAAEQKAINLSQGFPDFDPDPRLIESLVRATQSGKNQYAPMSGLPRLRQGVAELTQRKYNRIVNPETEVTITSGATEALFNAIATVVRPGDEVLILDPAYDSYAPAIILNGGIPISIPLQFPEYSLPWDTIHQASNSKTKAIIINSPHNPTGSVIGTEDINNLIQWTRKFPAWIISDEVYEHIIFDQLLHHSILLYPELADRALVISSFGKTFHVTGWKTGYCIAPAELTAEFRKIHQFNTFCSPTPLQEALADALEDSSMVDGLSSFYQTKRNLFLNLMKDSKFKAMKSRGTYFQLMDYSEISDFSDVDFCKWLTVEHKVAAIPVSVFYANQEDNKIIRFCFAKKEDTLREAAERLCKI